MNSIGEDLAYVSLENEGSLHARKGGICCPPWQLTMIHKYTSDPIHLAMYILHARSIFQLCCAYINIRDWSIFLTHDISFASSAHAALGARGPCFRALSSSFIS
mmetsp:Transcript_14583/g.38663  ORF Transcript_14583/g.38663 Transcript_14583/m.38663 type:complete len:104 (+) Transcript_14583:217-528(+)